MVDYYKILGVKPKASAAEIKSAYRRLARQRHPDVNGGSAQAAQDFALISLAYRTLSDPHERAYYDGLLLKYRGVPSVMHSSNPHAHRMRRVAMQARMDRVVDSLIEADRRETFALQQAVFPTVTLFISTFFAGMLKPRFWQNSGGVGRFIMVSLFVIGVWHLVTRLRTCFERYTYQPSVIHDSIMQEETKPDKPFTRFTASSFLIIGYIASFAIGLFVGEHMQYIILSAMPFFFDQKIQAELLFYPPIAVLIVDTMHTVASKIDA